MKRMAVWLLVLSMAAGARGETVALAWDPPATNTDGTVLTDLAGFNLYQGNASGAYALTTGVGNVTQYVATCNSSAVTWTGTNYALVCYPSSWALSWAAATGGTALTFYAVTAVNTVGRESEYSAELRYTNVASVTGYLLTWGTALEGMTNVINVGMATNYVGGVAGLPRKLVYLRPGCTTSAGVTNLYGATVAMNNRKPGAPKVK